MTVKLGEIKAWKNLGQSFEYIGTTMVVSAFTQQHIFTEWKWAMVCNYKDNNGEIRSITFSNAEIEAFIKMDKRREISYFTRTI